MKWFVIGSRLLLGLIFVVFGSDYFLNFMPDAPVSKQGGAFLEALLTTGYLFPLIKVVEILSGILLITGRYAAVGLTLVAPIALNIVLYHAFLDPNGRSVGFTAGALEAFLLVAYRRFYWSLFEAVPATREEIHEQRARAMAAAGLE